MSLRNIASASTILIAVAVGTAIAAPAPPHPKVDPSKALLDTPVMKALVKSSAKLQPKLSVQAKAAQLKVPVERVGAPFTLSPRQPWDATRGHLLAWEVHAMPGVNQFVSFKHGPDHYMLVKLENLAVNKGLLAECNVGTADERGTATLTVRSVGASAAQEIGPRSNRNVVMIFTPATRSDYVAVAFKGGPWTFNGCTFTPQR